MKETLKSIPYATILILPALLTGTVSKFILTISPFDSSFHPYLTVLIAITSILMLFKFSFFLKKAYELKYIGFFLLANGIWFFNCSTIDGYTTIISITLPVYAAFFMVFFTNNNVLVKTIYVFLNLFCFYLIINLLLFHFGYLPANNQNRMGGSYAEIVTLGYTIATLLPLYDYYFRFSNLKLFFIYGILFFALFSTQTRGGIWLGILFLIYSFYKKFIKGKKYKILLFLVSLIPISLFLTFFEFHLKNSRILEFTEPTRLLSFFTGITYWIDISIVKKIFGSGLNSFYDYQQWIRNGRDFSDNIFSYKNNISLVQPHNSFLWLFVETGVFGLFSIATILLKKIKLNDESTSLNFSLNLYCIAFIILNFFESTLIIYPNISIFFWYITFLRIKLISNEIKS